MLRASPWWVFASALLLVAIGLPSWKLAEVTTATPLSCNAPSGDDPHLSQRRGDESVVCEESVADAEDPMRMDSCGVGDIDSSKSSAHTFLQFVVEVESYDPVRSTSLDGDGDGGIRGDGVGGERRCEVLAPLSHAHPAVLIHLTRLLYRVCAARYCASRNHTTTYDAEEDRCVEVEGDVAGGDADADVDGSNPLITANEIFAITKAFYHHLDNLTQQQQQQGVDGHHRIYDVLRSPTWQSLVRSYRSRTAPSSAHCLPASSHAVARNASLFLSTLTRTIHNGRMLMRNDTAASTHSVSDGVRVAVVGGGPVGLFTALEAYRNGASHVTVIEKRSTYTRNRWFDLSPPHLAPSQAILASLGFDTQTRTDVVHHVGVGVVTVRAQIIERFLSKCLAIVHPRARVRYGWEYMASCPVPGEREAVGNEVDRGEEERNVGKGFGHGTGMAILHRVGAQIARNDGGADGGGGCADWCSVSYLRRFHALKHPIGVDDGEASDGDRHDLQEYLDESAVDDAALHSFVGVPFDILFGCDGSASRVREEFAMPFAVKEMVRVWNRTIDTADVLPSRHSNDGDDDNDNGKVLSQTTLLLSIIPDPETGDCPKLVMDPDFPEYTLDASYPGFLIPGVAAVFKRFYGKHCQLQVLFERDMGDQVLNAYNKAKGSDARGVGVTSSLFWSASAPSASSTSLPGHTCRTCLPGTKCFLRDQDQEGIPWTTLLKIFHIVLRDPKSIMGGGDGGDSGSDGGDGGGGGTELQSLFCNLSPINGITSSDNNNSDESSTSCCLPCDLNLFPIVIRSAQDMPVKLVVTSDDGHVDADGGGGRGGARGNGGGEGGGGDDGGSRAGGGFLVALAGDSSVTANYRLGIGLNHALRCLQHSGDLVRAVRLAIHSDTSLQHHHRGSGSWADVRQAIASEIQMTAEFETTVMFLETVCGVVPFFDFESSTYHETAMYFERDHVGREYVQLHTRRQVTEACRAAMKDMLGGG